jgi:hypothetical protein
VRVLARAKLTRTEVLGLEEWAALAKAAPS